MRNITRIAKAYRRSDDINHDITSVHDGDYWRLLTPGEYEVIVVADGYEPMAKLIEITENEHKTAPILNFELQKVGSNMELYDQNDEVESNNALDYFEDQDYY